MNLHLQGHWSDAQAIASEGSQCLCKCPSLRTRRHELRLRAVSPGARPRPPAHCRRRISPGHRILRPRRQLPRRSRRGRGRRHCCRGELVAVEVRVVRAGVRLRLSDSPGLSLRPSRNPAARRAVAIPFRGPDRSITSPMWSSVTSRRCSAESPTTTAWSNVEMRAVSTTVRAAEVTGSPPTTTTSDASNGAAWTCTPAVRPPPDV